MEDLGKLKGIGGLGNLGAIEAAPRGKDKDKDREKEKDKDKTKGGTE
jgi:hypothetical protein